MKGYWKRVEYYYTNNRLDKIFDPDYQILNHEAGMTVYYFYNSTLDFGSISLLESYDPLTLADFSQSCSADYFSTFEITSCFDDPVWHGHASQSINRNFKFTRSYDEQNYPSIVAIDANSSGSWGKIIYTYY